MDEDGDGRSKDSEACHASLNADTSRILQKINTANAWNFALIDYFHDMSLLRNNVDNSINFQKASCTLDGCVKIWTSRVDSVGTETGKLLSNLANEGKDDDNDEDGLRRGGRDGESRRQYGDRTDVEADRTMRSRQERGRGLLRDVYDSATTSAPDGGLRGSSSRLAYGDLDETRSMPDTSSNHSKATARLRALRDAKRKAAFGSTSRVETSDSDSGATGRGGGRRVEDSYAYGYERRSMSDLSSSRDGRNEMLRDSSRREPPPERPMPSVTAAAARVGLPSNPRRR